MTRGNLSIQDDTDRLVRVFLARAGLKKGDLSAFVEAACRREGDAFMNVIFFPCCWKRDGGLWHGGRFFKHDFRLRRRRVGRGTFRHLSVRPDMERLKGCAALAAHGLIFIGLYAALVTKDHRGTSASIEI